MGALPRAALAPIVFLSGVSALLFETVWFRAAGLTLGNDVWASSLVLAAFMSGLAVGNAWGARAAPGWRRPFLVYASCEATVGLLGLTAALALPRLAPVVAGVLGRWLDLQLALNAARLALAFAVMIVPAAAMGATLPALVRGALAPSASLGSLLGWLYGWNTAGAVAGALLGELWLLRILGMRGTAGAAALLNLLAAAGALAFQARARVGPASVQPSDRRPWTRRATRVVLAAGACGGLLLALEVVWFRFLLLLVFGSGLAFAVMLAVVLAGIAVGGWWGGAWAARQERAPRAAAPLALAAGALVVACYALFAAWPGRFVARAHEVAVVATILMLPVCLASGTLFVLLGGALHEEVREGARATGLLTLANTLGAVTGSLVAGFVLLPRAGLDGAFLALAIGYGVAAALVAREAPRRAGAVALLAWLAAIALFPRGLARRTIETQAARFTGAGARIVAVREGVAETITYLRRDLWSRPYEYRLLSNGVSMAGTNIGARRYMEMFAYLPAALGLEPRRAALVCYGVGNTAAALTTLPTLRRLDVVDISRDVLDLARLVERPRGNPLDDPRVRARVEDGRFFLAASRDLYDLITSEPPPPKQSGVVSLYTREYFQLVRERLTPGGMATHWLPVEQLTSADARSIVGGFCSVFADCTLWTGMGPEWVLAGSNGFRPPPDEAAGELPWREPAARARLRAVGFAGREQLLATFLADADDLRDFSAREPPLTDDFPLRLSPETPERPDPAFAALYDLAAARRRFRRSRWVAATLSPGLRARVGDAFWTRAVFDRVLQRSARQRLEDVARLTAGDPPSSGLALLRLDSSEAEVGLAEDAARSGDPDPMIPFVRGLGAVARAEWPRAEALLEQARARGAAVLDIDQALRFVRDRMSAGGGAPPDAPHSPPAAPRR